MPKSVKVFLDGKEYTITEKPSRENAAWRQRLDGPFQELAGLLEIAPGANLTDGAALAGIVRSVSGMLLGSIDTVRKLTVAYVGDGIPLDYDSDALDVFSAVLGLAYPFGSLLPRLRQLGSLAKPTVQSSPSPSGADGTTN